MKISDLIEDLRCYSEYDENIYFEEKGIDFRIESVGDDEDTWLVIKEA